MSHEKHLHDGKAKKKAVKSLKEKRLEKKAKTEGDILHLRKPRREKNPA